MSSLQYKLHHQFKMQMISKGVCLDAPVYVHHVVDGHNLQSELLQEDIHC